jgi:arsenite/tail-anchored protein-transporting ATPase
VLNRAAGVPMPGDQVFDAVERLYSDLEQVREILAGPDASVRLVLTPENVVLAEARRSYTTLSLFGYRVDGVVANRIFPPGGADPWRTAWVEAQERVMEGVEESFAGLPIWRSEYRGAEPVGVASLRQFAEEVYADTDPLASPVGVGPFRMTRSAEGAVVFVALPGATMADVDLARNGDELVVTVGSYHRLLAIPAGLSHHQVVKAQVRDGELQVHFAANAK